MASRDGGELAEILLEKAAGDLATLRAIIGAEEVPDEAIGLHAQQAVEKALKAVLASFGVRYPLTHDIDRLLELAEAEMLDVPDEIGRAGALTPWALAHRYESAPTLSPDTDDMVSLAAAAVSWARSVVHHAQT